MLPMANSTRESSIQARAIRIIEEAGGWVVPTTRLAPVKKGIPDLFGILCGVSLCPEIKGVSTPHQALQYEQRASMRASGCITWVARAEPGLVQVREVCDIIVEWWHDPLAMNDLIRKLELPA